MAEITISFSDYKAAGVYFEEIDNSVINPSNPVVRAQRLLVGTGAGTVYNRPVYLGSMNDVDALIGPIDKKSERKGSFFERSVRTAIKKSPIFAINLLPVNTVESSSNTDTVGINALSFDPLANNIAEKALFAQMYDRSKFWIASDTALMNAVNGLKTDSGARFTDKNHSPFFSVGNCSTKDISIIVKKAEGLSGYNVTFGDWFGNENDIPYRWIDKNEYVSDYFVQVIAIAGKWDESMYASLANDPSWKEYFSVDGLNQNKLGKFLRLDSVTVLGNWTGCIIPGFTDKQGKEQSIEYKINSVCNKTGLLFSVNNEALENMCGYTTKVGSTTAKESVYNYFVDVNGDSSYGGTGIEDSSFKIDMNFSTMRFSQLAGTSTATKYRFMSYAMNGYDREKMVMAVSKASLVNSSTTNVFVVKDSSSKLYELNSISTPKNITTNTIQVGDYVRGMDGKLTKVIKKSISKEVDASNNAVYTYKYMTKAPVCIFDVNTSPTIEKCVEVHKPIDIVSDMCLNIIPLTGLKLTNKHKPGYDASGNIDQEGGVEKIYNMLNDEGIRKGLLNNDMIDFRYVVDTMSYGMKPECGGKRHLAALAAAKQHCTALINLPSMSQFANSDAPFFGPTFDYGMDARPTFDVTYIAKGGNDDMVYPSGDVEFFSLPTVDHGSQNAAFFAPFFKYREGSRTILVPPAADMSNTFMNKFQGGDPYKTVANLNGIVVNNQIDSLEYDFDEEERGSLEKFGVNPVINHNGNVMIYGDRTAYQDVDSDLNFLHVRELLNTIEISCKNVLDDFVFTYNTAVNRAEIVSRLNPILSAMKESDALAKYEIQVDSNNNTKEVIDNKFCIVDIAVWINQNMEKIVTRITLNRSTDA